MQAAEPKMRLQPIREVAPARDGARPPAESAQNLPAALEAEAALYLDRLSNREKAIPCLILQVDVQLWVGPSSGSEPSSSDGLHSVPQLQ